MAQTNGATTFRYARVELSADGSTWIDVSGSVSGVTINGGERVKHEIRPLFADSQKVYTGAREPLTVSVKSVYTENASEAYALLDSAYLTNAVIYARWTPISSTPGAYRYKTVGARIIKPAYPGGDVSDAKPMLAEYEMSVESIEKEVTA